MTGDPVRLVAYRLDGAGDAPMPLVAAPRSRSWMDQTRERFAYRCLPLLIANQAGWLVLNTHTLLVTWDGGPHSESVTIQVLRGEGPAPVASHFGHGVLTWTVPYLFRTSPGYNLLMRGVPNLPKDGVTPLEGIVETDWSPATATMNHKLTRPGLTVRFDVDEPVCMVLPVARGVLEAVEPEVRDLAEEPELADQHRTWSVSRNTFLADLAAGGVPAGTPGWQRDYFQGSAPGGLHAPEHQRKLRLQPFTDRTVPASPSSSRPDAEPDREEP